MTGDGATTPEEAPGTAEELELADKELDGVAGSECYGIKRPKRGSASISCVTGPGGFFVGYRRSACRNQFTHEGGAADSPKGGQEARV